MSTIKTAIVAATALALNGLAANAEQTVTPWVAPTDPHAWPTNIWHPSGYIKMGINDAGNLNYGGEPSTLSIEGTRPTGLRLIDKDNALGRGAGIEYESTAAGCLCEAWGAAYTSSAGTTSGFANEDSGGPNNVTPAMLHGTAECMSTHTPADCQWATATATVGSCLRVVHDYQPSTKSNFAYNVDVSITNLCAEDITDLWYQRSMDWDIEPQKFNERVINNPGTAIDLMCLHDDGFCSGNPLDAGCTGILAGCAPANVETDTGVTDHGATFRFKFQDITAATPLAQGATKTFRTYYGAAFSTDQARSELAALGDVEAYSLGVYAGPDAGPTHFFGFAGVGGVIIDIPTGDTFTAPCECAAATVGADGTSVTLAFAENGPYTAECA